MRFFTLLILTAFIINRGYGQVIGHEFNDTSDIVGNLLLEMKSPENYFNSLRLSYHTGPYFSEESRQILLELLKNNWLTNEQKRELAVDLLWKRVDEQIKSLDIVIKDTSQLSGFDKSRRVKFQNYADSLRKLKTLNVDTIFEFQSALNNELQEIELRKVPNELVYTAGMLDDKRYVPILKAALSDTVHYDAYAVKMALARLGIDPYEKEMLNLHKVKIEELRQSDLIELTLYEQNHLFPALAYINTQKSIKEYAKLLQLDHFKRIDEDDYSIYSIPSGVLANLSFIVLNKDFQAYLEKVNPPDNVEKKDVEWVSKWIEKTYGNYKLNRDFYPLLP